MVSPDLMAAAAGRKDTAHDADVPAPDSVHCAALNTPRPLLVKLTVPDGAVALPAEVSLTTTVHSRNRFRDRWQVRTVEVARSVTVTVAWPVLAAWLASPL